MSMRILPPTRTSSSHAGLVKCFGPHHCAICFGSVHAAQTKARGASKTRVIVTVASFANAALAIIAIALLPFAFPEWTSTVLERDHGLEAADDHALGVERQVLRLHHRGEPLVLHDLGHDAVA